MNAAKQCHLLCISNTCKWLFVTDGTEAESLLWNSAAVPGENREDASPEVKEGGHCYRPKEEQSDRFYTTRIIKKRERDAVRATDGLRRLKRTGSNRCECISENIHQTQPPKYNVAFNKDADGWRRACMRALAACCQPQVEPLIVACWQPPARHLGFY